MTGFDHEHGPDTILTAAGVLDAALNDKEDDIIAVMRGTWEPEASTQLLAEILGAWWRLGAQNRRLAVRIISDMRRAALRANESPATPE